MYKIITPNEYMKHSFLIVKKYIHTSVANRKEQITFSKYSFIHTWYRKIFVVKIFTIIVQVINLLNNTPRFRSAQIVPKQNSGVNI